MNYRLIGLAFATVLLIGCANSSPDQMEQGRSDPLEGFNRAMFNFNYEVLDPYVVRPVAVVWRDYVPQPARNGMSNFLGNLEEPASMVNSFLVGDPYNAMKHFNRFFLNTILGMGGLIDVAGMANPKLAKKVPNRFGSTLGHYNVGYGPYVVLPGYGSFTIREDGGNAADYVYPVLSYLTFWMSAGKWMLDGVETRAQLLDSDGLLRNSSDPYLMVREAYFQRNDFLANGGQLKPEANSNAQAIEGDLESIDSPN
ncbi:phospholipid-binding lipoprotein MlaA [Yersinia enterocolitica]|uniref:phospholipid-binding lipoprotein MlaA n=1 Tax=Yersinia enterocolitica TaxID=630 RepID=UPI00028197E3|nr:phospholipid-binding lipoprotein MlaA [Yersinia enterocolitica]AJI81692.1 putative phospholipid-binding lipoprotein mlaA [Yersinia enterocolitica]EKA27065.1 ABC transporter outer membrane lipoprotein [Yersinia enterocolitica subsp. enterocolitica WA-314]KGA70564.1 putative phospholipid-binding lipoprotein mlaA [Yersinia enterocolitica]PNM14654.1 phospholipid-binding lipoprotein MlaA [Yersinia enterocolitica]CNK07733.1 VacJ lipoprotein [Yersinia enterocolitica]